MDVFHVGVPGPWYCEGWLPEMTVTFNFNNNCVYSAMNLSDPWEKGQVPHKMSDCPMIVTNTIKF